MSFDPDVTLSNEQHSKIYQQYYGNFKGQSGAISLKPFEVVVPQSQNIYEAAKNGLVSLEQANHSSKSGATPLLFAVKNEDVEAVNNLISSKADVNAMVDRLGNRALYYAVCLNNLAIATLLVTAGADMNAKNCFEVPLLNKAQGEILEMFQNHQAQKEALLNKLAEAGVKHFESADEATEALSNDDKERVSWPSRSDARAVTVAIQKNGVIYADRITKKDEIYTTIDSLYRK